MEQPTSVCQGTGRFRFPADPLGCDIELPLRRTFYPMGYPVEISANSAEPLHVAAKLWDRYPMLSRRDPVRLRVVASNAPPGAHRKAEAPRGHEHLVAIVHGAHDCAVADLAAGFGFADVTHDTASNHAYFRYHFLEPLVYLMLAARHFFFVHASCISRNGRAIVLCGESGAGKTCLAYACTKRGWDFVTGDALHVVRESEQRTVLGRPFEIRFRESARELFPELRHFRAELRPNGKSDLEVDTALLSMPVAVSSAAHSVVFIERSTTPELTRCTSEYAMRRLEETICFGDQKMRREQYDTLSRFVDLPAWRLRYSDSDSAEQVLGTLLV